MTCDKFLSNIYYMKVKNCFCKLICVSVHLSQMHKHQQSICKKSIFSVIRSTIAKIYFSQKMCLLRNPDTKVSSIWHVQHNFLMFHSVASWIKIRFGEQPLPIYFDTKSDRVLRQFRGSLLATQGSR